MLYAIRQIFLKGGTIKDAIAYVVKETGNMPTKSLGMKMINMFKNIQDDTAKVIKFPEDRITPWFDQSGEMSSRGKDIMKQGLAGLEQRAKKIEELNKKLKKALDEKKAMFSGSKDKTLFKDSPEAIAKIKADNKAAVERLKAKKKTVEDFRDDGDFDPGGMAQGGLAKILDL